MAAAGARRYWPIWILAAPLLAGIAVALRNWAAALVVAAATVCLGAVVLPRAVGSEAPTRLARDPERALGQHRPPALPNAAGRADRPRLADRRLGIADYEVIDLPGSDHRAVWARLVLP